MTIIILISNVIVAIQELCVRWTLMNVYRSRVRMAVIAWIRSTSSPAAVPRVSTIPPAPLTSANASAIHASMEAAAEIQSPGLSLIGQ